MNCEEVGEFVKSIDGFHGETSAYKNEGIHEVFQTLAEEIYNRPMLEPRRESIVLNRENTFYRCDSHYDYAVAGKRCSC